MLSFEDDAPMLDLRPPRTLSHAFMPGGGGANAIDAIRPPEQVVPAESFASIKSEDRRIINGEADVNQMVPFRYKWAWGQYLAGRANRWMPRETDMQRDIELWTSPNGLTADEHLIAKCNPGFFVAAESLASNNIVLGTYRHVAAPDSRQYLLRRACERPFARTHTGTSSKASGSTRARSSMPIARLPRFGTRTIS